MLRFKTKMFGAVRPIRLTRLAVLVAVAASFAASLHSQACAAGKPTTLGTVQLLPGRCPGGAGNLPRTICHLLRVHCDSIPSIDVQKTSSALRSPPVCSRSTKAPTRGASAAAWLMKICAIDYPLCLFSLADAPRKPET